jgi:hypothetical protein
MAIALSTIDNPYNPFIHWDEWYAYDLAHGYGTLSLLARVLVTSNELSDADQHVRYESAINEIVDENVSGVHIMVTESEGAESQKG